MPSPAFVKGRQSKSQGRSGARDFPRYLTPCCRQWREWYYAVRMPLASPPHITPRHAHTTGASIHLCMPLARRFEKCHFRLLLFNFGHRAQPLPTSRAIVSLPLPSLSDIGFPSMIEVMRIIDSDNTLRRRLYFDRVLLIRYRHTTR